MLEPALKAGGARITAANEILFQPGGTDSVTASPPPPRPRTPNPPPEMKAPDKISTTGNEQLPNPLQLPEIKIYLGIGATYLDFAQSGTETQSLSYSSVALPSGSLMASAEWKNGYGLEGSAGIYPGELKSKVAELVNSKFNWETQILEGTARMDRLSLGDSIFRFRLGIQHHRLPYIQFPTITTAEIKTHELYNATFGLDFQIKMDERWYLTSLLRYQIPIAQSSSEESFEFKSRFAFDGSVGISRSVGEKFSLGAFWYGQWLELNYTGRNVALGTTDSGSNKFFFSNLEIRIGYKF